MIFKFHTYQAGNQKSQVNFYYFLSPGISRFWILLLLTLENFSDVFAFLICFFCFAKVAQEWINSPNNEKFHQLHLRKFPGDYKKYWDFVGKFFLKYLEQCHVIIGEISFEGTR